MPEKFFLPILAMPVVGDVENQHVVRVCTQHVNENIRHTNSNIHANLYERNCIKIKNIFGVY